MNKENIIAGVDEVGRGCLFGPVFAGAVILSKLNAKKLKEEGLNDSKLLSHKKRAYLVPLIKSLSTGWGLGQASPNEIDKHGIRRATEIAMIRAIEKLSNLPNLILVDGNLPLSLWKGEQRNIVKGDIKFAEISAASVLAKESRDSLIKHLASLFPQYGLEKNVGYGTKRHIEALKLHGPTNLHRISFLKNIRKRNF